MERAVGDGLASASDADLADESEAARKAKASGHE